MNKKNVFIIIAALAILGGLILYSSMLKKKQNNNPVAANLINQTNQEKNNSDINPLVSPEDQKKYLENYNAAKEIFTTVEIEKNLEAEINPVLSEVFGKAKLVHINASGPEEASFEYIFERKIIPSDMDSLLNEFQKKGYAKDMEENKPDSLLVSVKKNDFIIFMIVSGDQNFSISSFKDSPTQDEANSNDSSN